MSETEAVAAESYLGEDGAFQEGWMDNLPEDTFEKDDTGKPKQGDLADHKDVASVVKSYLNAQKLLGTAIQPLPDTPTEEQVKAHRAKVGCPETAEGYEVAKPELPEGMDFDEELVKNISKYAHDNHVPKGVFEGMAKLLIEGQTETFKKITAANAKAEQEAKDKAIETAENQLKGKHGAKYDEVVETANRFYDLPGDDAVNKAFTDLMEERGLNSHPAVVEFFHEAFKLVQEESTPESGSPTGGKQAVPGQLDYSTVHGHSGR
jgi:hypothetical protein